MITFDQLLIASGEELSSKERVARELVTDNVQHHLKLDILPVLTQRDLAAELLSLASGNVLNEHLPQEGVGCLTCLVSVLSAVVRNVLELYGSAVEAG